MQISTRKIVIAGVLLAVALILSTTGIGYFPVPNVSDAATIMHVPGIIGAVLEGPVVGVLVAIVFAIDSYVRYAQIFFADRPVWQPILVLSLTRLLIPVGGWLAYTALKKMNELVALAAAGIAGGLTNTVLVVGLGILLGVLPVAVIPAVLPQAIFEALLAAVVTVAVVAAWKRLAVRGGKSTV
jgi:uncharacterized membrane protein